MENNYCKLRSLARAVSRKLKYLQKETVNFVHVVVVHLCHKLDNSTDATSDTESASIFEGIVSTLNEYEKW